MEKNGEKRITMEKKNGKIDKNGEKWRKMEKKLEENEEHEGN
jgi:hypothetical protein